MFSLLADTEVFEAGSGGIRFALGSDGGGHVEEADHPQVDSPPTQLSWWKVLEWLVFGGGVGWVEGTLWLGAGLPFVQSWGLEGRKE